MSEGEAAVWLPKWNGRDEYNWEGFDVKIVAER